MIGAMLASVAADAATAFDLAQWASMLARTERSVVAFEETRHFRVMSTPIKRSGTLSYARPDRLEMQVVRPFPETVEVTGNRIRVESADSRREWDLASQPSALAWIEAIRASLAGDAATLTRLFRTDLRGTEAEWTLRLEPLDARVAASLVRVELRGRRAQLSRIEISDRQGDRIVIVLTPLAGNAK
jgi:outer membrane lipoprotein-sorting protein